VNTLEHAQTESTSLDKMSHWICTDCHPQNPEFALCGYPVSKFAQDNEAACVVCEDLFDKPCAKGH
jgi:hypothetical protein